MCLEIIPLFILNLSTKCYCYWPCLANVLGEKFKFLEIGQGHLTLSFPFLPSFRSLLLLAIVA